MTKIQNREIVRRGKVEPGMWLNTMPESGISEHPYAVGDNVRGLLASQEFHDDIHYRGSDSVCTMPSVCNLMKMNCLKACCLDASEVVFFFKSRFSENN